jgi:photosystem II stability/assembly factor-like uncharacterized protein
LGKARVAPLFSRVWLLGVFLAVVALAAAVPAGAIPQDINPNASDNSNANASSGGRVNGLSSDPGSNQVFYAASEYGGLFKTTDGGNNWSRLNGHLPVVTWDVEVDPSNSQRVFATSWYDGRVNTLAGIEVSTDGGATWTRPATATPPVAYNCAAARRTEPSAFGIGIQPGATQNVFIGTNCGLAISTDSGVTWNFVDPTPATPATNVWDVVVQTGGIIDICGDDGHRRSTDGGANWTGAIALPAGRCSIAASPDESYVLFVVASDNNVYESDNAGGAWTNLGSQGAQGRIPFVVTNQRADDGTTNRFRLWYSDTQLFRADCTTPATPAQGGAARCPTSGSWSNQQTGAHWDAGDLVFDTQTTQDGGGCPRIYSTDGGVHRNTDLGSGCHSPNWTRSNAGLHALWLWSMDGATQAGDANEDLYFGNQDNGTFATTNAGAGTPTWTNPRCCDTFDLLADPAWVLGSVCCFQAPNRFNQLERANAGYGSAGQINTYPAGNIPGFTWGKRLAQFGADDVAMITSAGIFITNDINANPIVWSQLGAMPAGTNPCGIQAAVTGGNPTFFVQSGQCTGRGNDQVHSYVGTGSGGTWTRLDNNDGLAGGFGIFAVDPNNPNRMYASNLPATGPQMVFSTDGGANWNADPELDVLMTAGGVFQYQNQRGPSTNRNSAAAVFQGYPQPLLLAYDPEDGNILVAGGVDSGVFLSVDGGANWSLVTDPINPVGSGKAHLPRPRFAYFDHEPAGSVNVYIGTQGRGVWRLPFQMPTADAADATTPEGVNVTVTAAASTDPDGGPLTYEWDLDNDGQFDDATGVTATFALVGQDGFFPIAVKATDPDGGFDTDTATVTVTNVAPTVNATANDPKDEGSPVTVTGTISDPGWLENLSATIDWGDPNDPGTETISGTLENVRDDATLSFTVSHIYADDEPPGQDDLYQAEICGSDDDTTTCLTLDIEVRNVPPVLGAITAPTGPVKIGTEITVSANFTDVGILDTHTAVWDWGDGTPLQVGTVSQGAGSGSVTDTHTYTSSDLYTVTLTVTDDDLDSDTEVFEYVIVFDPDRSLAANAKINSPPNAYVPNASKVGLAYSTAGARYKSDDAVIPSGGATFQFSAVPFYFNSGSLDWLVVANGGRGYLQGTGSVNSVPGYTFLLSVVDAQIPGAPQPTDSYRLKVWNTTTDVVVYDSQFGAPIKTPANIALLAGSVQLFY